MPKMRIDVFEGVADVGRAERGFLKDRGMQRLESPGKASLSFSLSLSLTLPLPRSRQMQQQTAATVEKVFPVADHSFFDRATCSG